VFSNFVPSRRVYGDVKFPKNKVRKNERDGCLTLPYPAPSGASSKDLEMHVGDVAVGDFDGPADLAFEVDVPSRENSREHNNVYNLTGNIATCSVGQCCT